MDWLETKIRVRYAETDQMGIVHHSNYYVWFELGRSEVCRAKGFSYREMEETEGALMVVAESYCRYKSPAFYDDLIIIKTKAERIRSRSIIFIYQIYRPTDKTILAEGKTVHIVTNKDKEICSLPSKYRKMLIS